MLMELVQLRAAHPDEPDEIYEEDLHDVDAIIMDICGALGDTGAFDFRVSGFGDHGWPVDVATDLATVLAQLPAALSACAGGQPFAIDFFEQGVQRRLDFVPGDGAYRVTCLSGTEWTPDPATELIEADYLRTMLRGLGRTFVSVACKHLPRATSHPWFSKYASAVS